MFSSFLLKAAILSCVLCTVHHAAAADFSVATTIDAGPGSLRQAILDSNANGAGQTDRIFFVLAAGVPVIALSSPLPPITSPVVIQNFYRDNTKAAEIRVVASEHGFRVESDQVEIRDLIISGAGPDKAQVRFAGVTGGGVFDCFINPEFSAGAVLQSNYGIWLARNGPLGFCRSIQIKDCLIMAAMDAGVRMDSTVNFTGFPTLSTSSVTRCSILRCGIGISLEEAGRVNIEECTIDSNNSHGIFAKNCGPRVDKCTIGLEPVGLSPFYHPNRGSGIWVEGNEAPILGNNIICGNDGNGVTLQLLGFRIGGPIIFGNYIGTNKEGTAARPNGGHGIAILSHDTADGSSTILGRNSPNERPNVISGNALNGILISGVNTRDLTLANSRIGTNAAGTAAIPNGFAGIAVNDGARDIRIGSMSEQPNVISGNLNQGIVIEPARFAGDGAVVRGVTVENCRIGTTFDQAFDLGNGRVGIAIRREVENAVVRQCTIAATYPISAGGTGVGVELSPTGPGPIQVSNNFIGTNPSYTALILGNQYGISLTSGTDGSVTVQQNTIAGNELRGISVTGGAGALITQNSIGHVTARNRGPGIVIDGSTSPSITRNVITYHPSDGIVLRGSAYSFLSRNTLHSNSGLGINLQPSGEPTSTPTPNDVGDTDGGPNSGMNKPVITAVVESGNSWIVSGTLDSLQSETFIASIELFGVSYQHWSGRPHAEAEYFLGGIGTFASTWTLAVPKQPGIAYLCATATLTSATSEISAPVFATNGYQLEVLNFERTLPLPGGPPTAFGFNLDYTCRPGKTYELQRSSTLRAGSWSTAGTRRPDFVGFDRFFQPYEGGTLFWRVLELP